MSTRALAVGSAVSGLLAWVGAIAGFLVYLNWFSETGRAGGSLVLAFAWMCVFVGLVAVLALVTTALVRVLESARSHA